MISNFSFLTERFPALEKLGTLAEGYLYSDSNSCLYKLGSLAEILVNYMFELEKLTQPAKDNTHANRIKILQYEDLLTPEISDILYVIRITRNVAVHEGYESFEECKTLLEMAHTLTGWFMQIYGDYEYEPIAFVLPEDIRNEENYLKLLEENEKLSAELEKAQAMALSTMIHRHIDISERRKRAAKAARNLHLSAREIRFIIDRQLRKVGWEADSVNLRYSKGTRPEEGRNIAIAEWPTDLTMCQWGYADYALFAGQKLVGVVEAKATRNDISSSISNQCREYSMGIKEEHAVYQINSWGIYKAPFLFATNGKPYSPQFPTKSGIWFRDARRDSNLPKVLQGWIGPQGLLDMLKKNTDSANKMLAESSYDPLCERNGLALRAYQVEAIEKAEAAVLAGRQTVLLAMATGTGKTRTVLGMLYRFLKTGRFKRILYLVDQAILSELALDVFEEVKIEDLMTLEQIYEINKQDNKDLCWENKLHVATVQSLIKRILFSDDESMPSVTDYDLIIVDEAHRGYKHGHELCDDELLYRSQSEYMSKYRSVLEYFDAVKIALTATPTRFTTEIFGKPVFEYSHYRMTSESCKHALNDLPSSTKSGEQIALQLEEAAHLIMIAIKKLQNLDI